MSNKETVVKRKKRLDLSNKVDKFIKTMNGGLKKEMPLITQMTPSEYHAMLFGIYLSGYNPMKAIDLVKNKIKMELIALEES